MAASTTDIGIKENDMKLAEIRDSLPKEVKASSGNVERLEAMASQIKVRNEQEASSASEYARNVRALYNEVEGRRKAYKAPVIELGKMIDLDFGGLAQRLKAAEKVVTGKVATWTFAERKKAEEASRIASEKAERARHRAEEKAEQYREEGRNAMADKWEDRAAEAGSAPTMAPPAMPRGMHTRKAYGAEVRDLNALIRAAAEQISSGKVAGLDLASFLQPNMVALNKIVTATKGVIDIPGVKVVVTESAIMRTGCGGGCCIRSGGSDDQR